MSIVEKVELLAPVGSFDALKAAILAGCDALYLGGSAFGARAYAKNFDDEEIIRAVKLAHIYDVKVYVTLNTLIYDDEFDQAMRYVDFLYHNDVDAVIVQDLGLLRAIRRYYPDFELHTSTQMTIHNLEGVEFLRKQGVSRIVLARENTIDEIRRINQHVNVDTEVFVHGALCVCYSGQCLMSSLIGGRSGNRGRCAQPCRKLYHLHLNDDVIEKDKFMISPKDLNTIEHIGELIEAGVKSLKIEGRMKSPEYVAIVVSTYRKAIDEYYKSKEINISKNDMHRLTQIFNRQFTKGFLFGDHGNDYINLDKNNNSGVFCGEVLSCVKQKATIKLTMDLNVKDGIYFENTHQGLTISKMYNRKNIEIQSAKENDIIILDVKENVPNTTRVFKITDALLMEEAQAMYSNLGEQIPISGKVELYLNQQPKITLHDELGHQVVRELDYLIESSKNQSMTTSKIESQLKKLGNTPYYYTHLDVLMDEEIFIPMGVLNELRRQGIEALSQLRETRYSRTGEYKYKYGTLEKLSRDDSIELSVYCRTKDQVKAAETLQFDKIYVDEELNWVQDTSRYYLSKNRIIPEVELDEGFKGWVISELGSLNVIKKGHKEVISNMNLNVTNSESILFLKENNVETITLSYEMNETKLKQLKYPSKEDLQIVIYGYQEAMITKHCVFKSNCRKQCKVEGYYLKDEKKENFKIFMDRECHMHILNSKRLILVEEVQKLILMGYRKFRLQLTVENFEESLEILKGYKNLLFDNDPKYLNRIVDKNKEQQQFTRGYFNKDIL